MKQSVRIRLAVLLALAGLMTAPVLRAQAPAPVPPEPPAVPVAPVARIEVETEVGEEGGPVQDVFRQAQDELRGAHEEVARAMRDVQKRVKTFRLDAGGPNVTRTLVIPVPDATAEQVGQIREDLTIMSRVLQKAASPETKGNSRFRFDFGDVRFGGRSDLDALFIEGFGAVFLLEVDFPLSAPVKEAAKKSDAKEKKDSAWEEARREVAGKGDPDELLDDEEFDEEAAGKFDEAKVERLKERVTAALKSAANVRCLNGSDKVVVQVTGRPGRKSHAMAMHADRKPGGVIVSSSSASRGNSSVLTFQTTRDVVAAFSEGKLDEAAFAKKLRVSLRDEVEATTVKRQKF